MPPPPTGVRPAISKPAPKPTKIRYFKGKAPDAPPSDSESDDDEEEQQQQQQIKKRHEATKIDKNYVAGGAGRVIMPGGGVKMELGSVKVGGTKMPLGKDGGVKEESSEEETDEESEEDAKPGVEDESSEYETDSEEESEPEPPKPVFRPVFKPKNARNTTAEKAAQEAEEAARREEEMREEKKLASKELAGETIRRELAEREAQTVEQTVDDTDGLDPTSEFDAWRARELSRLLRDKQAQAARDEEQAEIERRRAMPEEQRMAEDLEFANKTREKEKGQMGFLQKYYHKGAFHQDDDILQRDYTGATEHSVDMSMLPKVMQVRDFGKASRSKYTHLADQDTSQGGWGNTAKMGAGGVATTQTGCWNCGGPHLRKDCPNNNINDPGQASLTGGYGTSANTAQLGSGSKWGNNGDGYNDRDRDDRGGGRYRDEGRERRFDEERRRDRDDRDRDRDEYRDRDKDRDYGRDRYRDERRRERSYSPSNRKRDSRDDRDRDDRRRDERDKDRYRDRERERDRDRDKDRDRRR